MVLEDASSSYTSSSSRNISSPNTPSSSGSSIPSTITLIQPIDCGLCFGPGSPLNWTHSSTDIFTHANQYYGTAIELTSSAFYLAAKLHSSYFQDSSLLTYPWLRGVAYYTATGMNPSSSTGTEQYEGKTEFMNTQAYAINNWHTYLRKSTTEGSEKWLRQYDKLRNSTSNISPNDADSIRSNYASCINIHNNTTVHTINDVQWPEFLLQCITLSLGQIDWETFKESLGTDKFRQHYTLVHGDYHPGNILVYPRPSTSIHPTSTSTTSTTSTTDTNPSIRVEYPSIMVVDFENVGIGSGPQDCGQFIISHMDIKERQQSNEKQLFYRHYYQHLSPKLQSVFTFDECYQEYVYGGIERWIWLLCLLCGLCPAPYIQFWVHQITAFMKDHQMQPSLLRMPRL